MSYYNQPDHELLDRRDEDARALLMRLARSRLTGLGAPSIGSSTQPGVPTTTQGAGGALAAWLDYASVRGIPAPDDVPLQIDGETLPLVWRAHYVVAIQEGNAALIASLERQGLEVVVLGNVHSGWPEPTTRLAKLLGSRS
jgi:hypothetical protein